MRTLIVIPARYGSTRYEGKPLVPLRGADGSAKTLIQRSFLAATQVSGVDIVVATDDARIADAACAFGADVAMTSTTCQNGTERCAEVLAQRLGYDLVVNLQGDAPLTPPWFIDALIAAMAQDQSAAVATPVLRCDGKMRAALIADRMAGRVGGTTALFRPNGHALYFSKEVVPFSAKTYADDAETPVFHHVGVYAYRPAALAAYPSLPSGVYENLEGLEQLRFVENGHSVLCVQVDAKGREFWELNNPSDVEKLEAMMLAMGMS